MTSPGNHTPEEELDFYFFRACKGPLKIWFKNINDERIMTWMASRDISWLHSHTNIDVSHGGVICNFWQTILQYLSQCGIEVQSMYVYCSKK